MVEDSYVNWGDTLVTFLVYGVIILLVVLLVTWIIKKTKKQRR